MADVFISYRKADRAKAEALAKALKVENLDVWWDTALETGQTFDEKIQAALEQAKAVIVIWSKESVKSDWVRAESSIGRERGILVPIMVQPVNIPVPFNLIHTADLIGWSGDRAHPGYRDVVKQVKTLAGKSHVAPLKPPPNRALRALWRAVAVVAVVAAIGASVWVFRPWEALRPVDPVVEAKKAAEEKREASLDKLAPYGLAAGDLDKYSSRYIADRLFKQDTKAQLNAAAESGDPVILALKCAVDLWTFVDDHPDYESADLSCAKASEAGEPAAQVFMGDLLMEAYAFAQVGEEQRTGFRTSALAEYQKAAQAGSAWGQISEGRLLVDNEAIADPAKAEKLFKLAQAKGLPEADFMLGRLYLSGAVSGPDPDAALAMVRKAADAGVQEAQSYFANQITDSFAAAPLEALELSRAYNETCTKGVDPYLAFRCQESITGLEPMIARAKAEKTQLPAAPAPSPN
ncbi:MAG: toll/interleukin-1 receptor domain-containing protein [Hyphomonadaceae bacterium]